jgi:hypothetical protein
MYSQRFYRIVEFICEFTCLTGISGLQFDCKTASAFITIRKRKRNNVGMLIITNSVVYSVLMTIHIYFREDRSAFPICYIFSLVQIILWIVVFISYIKREDMKYLFTQMFAVANRFHSKNITRYYVQYISH